MLLFIFGQVLKFIAIILLAIVIILLLSCVLILFVPIKYSASLEKQENILLDLKVTWLFKIISFAYFMKDKESRIIFKVFNQNLIGREPSLQKLRKRFKKFSGKKKKKENLEKEQNKKAKADTAKEADTTQNEKHWQEKNIQDVKKQASQKKEKEDIPKKNITKEKKEKKLKKIKLKKEKKPKKSKEKKESFGNKIEMLKEQFDSVYHYPDRKILTKLTIQYLKKMLKALKPEAFSLKLEIGLNEPDKLGYILGITQTIIPITRLDITVKGVFDKELLNGNTDIKGKIYIYKFVFPTLQYVFTKPVWKIIKKTFL